MNKNIIKLISKLTAGIMIITMFANFNISVFAVEDSSDLTRIETVNEAYVYDSTDSIIITRSNVPRTLPEVTGRYDLDKYPIPEVNKVPNEETFELIKAENKELMDRVVEDIANGTLKKHVAADGQFYGTVSDSALGVEKRIYINTNAKGAHSLASYVPAGEIATVTLSDEALKYAKEGKIKITVGMTYVDAESYGYNSGSDNRMPYLSKEFSITENETKVGTPFGGLVCMEISDSIPSGLSLEVNIKGVVDTPYYDLGKTSSEEWLESREAPGLFAEVRTPYLRFIMPSKFIRDIDDLYKSTLFWTNVASLSSYVMGQLERTTPMTMVFDQYISVGSAYALVGGWRCHMPPGWATGALNYDLLMSNGNWGTIHEINHHYQSNKSGGYAWGLGDEFSEITNNALSAISYILYTNIASYRGESGTEDWNKVADPYSSLKQQIYEGDRYYVGKANMGNFVFSTFAHEVGPINLAEVIKSTYDGAVINGITLAPYSYKDENAGILSRNDRYDDFAYRLCVAGERDYTWYMINELAWPLKDETIKRIKSLGYEEYVPVQTVYGVGEVGRETGRAYYVPSTGYTFNFENSLISPANVTVVDVSDPRYGTLIKRDDGKYDYTPDLSSEETTKDEFILTVDVEYDGYHQETQLKCLINVNYNSSAVETYKVYKWDIYEALEDVKTKQPYAASFSDGMKITTDDDESLAMSTAYFTVKESGEYEFQVFGDDRAAFTLYMEDGREELSVCNNSISSPSEAYGRADTTSFKVYLEADKPYKYTLITKNIWYSGWANVNLRRTNGDNTWKSIDNVYATLDLVGRTTDRSYEMIDPVYVRPSTVAASNQTFVTGMSVISTPEGVKYDPNNPITLQEGNKDNIVDGDISTYFHSAHSGNMTPFPHDYIIDLGGEKDFNYLEVYTRLESQGQLAGVIGDYEIYAADEYNGLDTEWRLIKSDYTRKGSSSASSDLKLELEETTASYLMVRALNNRNDYKITIISEIKVSNKTTVNSVIAQNSNYIQYDGKWDVDTEGAYVSGAAYRTLDGYFTYSFEGKETNIYAIKDAEVKVRIDGGRWRRVKLTGSLREPSLILKMDSAEQHTIEVRAIGKDLTLNMISTDGKFCSANVADKSEAPNIYGASNIEISIKDFSTFDSLAGITVSDDIEELTLEDLKVEGTVEEPLPGESKVSTLTYSIKDSNGNVTTIARKVTVTNGKPEIINIPEVTVKFGASYDLKDNVTAYDYEDKDITHKIEYPHVDVSTLSVGTHNVKYSVKDSDNNVTEVFRIINVIKSDAPMITGADDKTIKVSQVDTFDNMAGIGYTDDIDITGLKIEVTGNIGKPASGTNEDYTLIYTVKDSDGNITSVKRVITVTNQKPTITNLDDINIIEGQGKYFDFKKGIVSQDLEDGELTHLVNLPEIDLSSLSQGVHFILYKVTDSDGNETIEKRIVNVLPKKIDAINPDDNVNNNHNSGAVVIPDNNTAIVPGYNTSIKTENSIIMSDTIEYLTSITNPLEEDNIQKTKVEVIENIDVIVDEETELELNTDSETSNLRNTKDVESEKSSLYFRGVLITVALIILAAGAYIALRKIKLK